MDGERCGQAGCAGVIEGGFCNTCGLEPPRGSTPGLAAGAVPVTTGVALAGPTVTGTVQGSVKTGSALAGSAKGSVGSSLTGRSGLSRRGSGSTRASSRKNLGLGLVTVPELPQPDPELAVMKDPVVPDHKRFCANPDCHDADGNPTPLRHRQSGFCPQCGTRYSFLPTLAPGDLIANQYLVKGCLAYGGLGWIYLGRDQLLNRWVVLKGLLNAADESAAAAAVAERQFLAAVKHPNIVGIYNFASRGSEGYIVMEYIGGTTLKDIRKQRGPLPAAEAIAYVHRILGAFTYLHRQGLVYCDMKPDNFMVEGDPPDVKLIDLGGVRRIDDPGGDIYGTKGYSAPEAGDGPTIVSDLFTLGRTLAVLLMDFRFQGAYEFTIPPPAEQPVLARFESLYRFLLKATASDPDHRFQSPDEMADQLGGVLREVVAMTRDPGDKSPLSAAESLHFTGDLAALRDADPVLDKPGPGLLPELKIDPADPKAGVILSTALVTDPRKRFGLLQEGNRRPGDSAELPLMMARCLLAAGDPDEAEGYLAEVERKDAFDWRVSWYRGAVGLSRGTPDEAVKLFERVYAEVPGEVAARLAVAVAAEAAGHLDRAIDLYDRVSRTDPSFCTASFGLARCRLAAGTVTEAVEAYRRVPPSSNLYPRAQLATARALLGTQANLPAAQQLREAAEVVQALTIEGLEQARARVDVFDRALSLVLTRDGGTAAALAGGRILGHPPEESALRRALEDALRRFARLEKDRTHRIWLIDRANRVRPRTWI